jgi:two-component system, sensor histidine kinase PdtaS
MKGLGHSWACVNLHIMARFLFLYLMACWAMATRAQGKVPTAEELLFRYQNSRSDTGKVRLLLQLDSLYLYNMPDTKAVLDSAVLMADEAMKMSQSLRFGQGYEDAAFLWANSFAEKNEVSPALAVLNKVADTFKVRLLIMLGEHYLFKPGGLRQNLDSACLFAGWAKKLSDSQHAMLSTYQSLALLGKYYFTMGDFAQGKDCYLRIIRDYHQSGNKNKEAFWWSELEVYIPDTDSTYADEISYLEHALSLYRQTGNKTAEPDVLEDMAYVYQVHDSLTLAEGKLLEAIAIRQSLGKKKLFSDYYSLTKINLAGGNYQRTLSYALAALRNMEAIGDKNEAGVIYYELGDAYGALGETEESIRWYRTSLQTLVAFRAQYIFPVCSRIVHSLLQMDSVAKALSFLEDFIRENPPLNPADKELMAQAKGDCYTDLGRYSVAEANYLKMIALDTEEQAHFNNEIAGRDMEKLIVGSEAYYTIGSFYVGRGKFTLARPYLRKALATHSFAPSLSRQRDIHWMLGRMDSAAGNYRSAIFHFEQRRILNDSIFNVTKSKQIEELKIMYATEEKDSDITHKDQVIRIMTSQAQLQQSALREERIARNAILFAALLLAALLALSYNRYRLKQRNNKKLELQQRAINEANNSLRLLLSEKDALLGEKEWLLKEVHHRVKNNLQIMISLLNTQSKFLDSEEAIAAIRESRHRMQAMSLIHQKLYQSENAALVKMQTYVQELVSYLEVSFKPSQPIRFDIQVEAIELDISQAIPVGLILNEAITNAIKYAFQGTEGGTISVVMKRGQNDDIEIDIKDNGKGLPEDFDVRSSTTMGMRLMRGLVRQIEATMTLINEQGLTIKIVL